VLEEITGLRGLEGQAALLQEAQSGRAARQGTMPGAYVGSGALSAAGEALEALETLVRRSP
jgi:hypothetical protein